MKKSRGSKTDDLRSEYDFSSMRGGVRGKYVKHLREHSNVIVLDAAVAVAFPNGAAVNEAFRAVIDASRVMRRGP